MAVSEFFTAESPAAESPLRLVGLTRLAVGAIHLLAGGITAALLLPELQYVIAASRYGTPSLVGIFDAVRAVVGAAVALRGARLVAAGAAAMAHGTFPSTAPADLAPAEAEAALARREAGAFRRAPRRGLRVLRRWLPQHEAALASRLRVVVDAGLGEVGRFARLALFVAGGLAAIAALPALRQTLFAGVQPGVPGLFLTLFGAGAALHAWVAIRALPVAAPRSDVREFRGFVPPGTAFPRLAHLVRQELSAIRATDGQPNRAHESGGGRERADRHDAGLVDGTLFVETQPRFAGLADAPLAPVLLVAGAVVQVLSLAWLLGAPDRPRALITGTPADVAASLLFAGQLLAGTMLGRLGARMLGSGGELLRAFRFESLALLLQVRGGCVTGHVARLLTESREPLGERMVVGMVADDRAAEVELLVRRVLWRADRRSAPLAAAPMVDVEPADAIPARSVSR